MAPLPAPATNRLPDLSKVSPSGSLNPEAKALRAPFGVNSSMLPRPASDTNRFCASALEQIRMTAPKHSTSLIKWRLTPTPDLNFVSVSLFFMFYFLVEVLTCVITSYYRKLKAKFPINLRRQNRTGIGKSESA